MYLSTDFAYFVFFFYFFEQDSKAPSYFVFKVKMKNEQDIYTLRESYLHL